MTADEIIEAIAWQTKALRDQGRTPVAVQIGREQDAALSSEKGFTSNLLMVTAPGALSPHSGRRANPSRRPKPCGCSCASSEWTKTAAFS